MSQITFENNEITANDNESVLDALTRHGHDVASGCRSGVCQTCLMSIKSGVLPKQAQQGLSPSQVKLNYFLSCQCVAAEPISINRINASHLKEKAIVTHKELLGGKILLLRLKASINFLPGQYLTLWRDDTVGRSYSIASRPEEGVIECHIKVIEQGQFSSWARDNLNVGDSIQIQGPMGDCIFTAEQEQPLLLAGIGTGLAPLYGIIKQALSSQHLGPIHLVLGAKNKSDFYLIDELETLASSHPNLTVHTLSQDMEKGGDIYQYCRTTFSDLKGWRVFICGADSFVSKMHKQCFLAGAAMDAISADRFLSCSS